MVQQEWLLFESCWTLIAFERFLTRVVSHMDLRKSDEIKEEITGKEFSKSSLLSGPVSSEKICRSLDTGKACRSCGAVRGRAKAISR